jgi:hypothetical protein
MPAPTILTPPIIGILNGVLLSAVFWAAVAAVWWLA